MRESFIQAFFTLREKQFQTKDTQYQQINDSCISIAKKYEYTFEWVSNAQFYGVGASPDNKSGFLWSSGWKDTPFGRLIWNGVFKNDQILYASKMIDGVTGNVEQWQQLAAAKPNHPPKTIPDICKRVD